MTPADTVGAALAKVATAVDQVAGERWSFAMTNGTRLAASARLDDGWVALDAPLDVQPTPGRESRMLDWNATLGGGARFALAADAPGTRVRADVPLEPGVDVTRRIIEACAGFRTAATYLHGAAPDTGTPALPHAEAIGDLPARCHETGWSVKERDGGCIAVDLDVAGAFHQALVEQRPDGAVAVSVPVLEAAVSGTASDTCRRALALLLARVCGVVRFARATAIAGDGRSAVFEVVHLQPSVAELDHAFAALSVACRLAAAEAAVLWHDEAVASVYVSLWDEASRRWSA